MNQKAHSLNPAAIVDTDVALIGQIIRITDTSIVLSSPIGPTGDLNLTEQTQIFRQVQATPEDVTVGAPVMVVGIQGSSSMQAVEVQIGGDQSFIPPGYGDAPAQGDSVVMMVNNADEQSGAPPPEPTFLAGVVAQFDGKNLVVSTATHARISMTLSKRAMIQKFIPAAISDLRVGKVVQARRVANSTQLTRLCILNPPALSR